MSVRCINFLSLDKSGVFIDILRIMTNIFIDDKLECKNCI